MNFDYHSGLDAALDGEQPHYRLTILSAAGQVRRSFPLKALDDIEALAKAHAAVDGHAVELWDGLRFIEHFEAARSAA